MAGYGYGASVSGSRTAIVGSSGGAAPSGIPVASTTNLVITFSDSYFTFVNQTYTKFIYPTAYYYTSPIPSVGPDLVFDFGDYPEVWSFTSSDGEGGRILNAYNSSTNGAYIPTTGWTGGFTTFTITAA